MMGLARFRADSLIVLYRVLLLNVPSLRFPFIRVWPVPVRLSLKVRFRLLLHIAVPLGRVSGIRPVVIRGVGIIVAGAMANTNFPHAYALFCVKLVDWCSRRPVFVKIKLADWRPRRPVWCVWDWCSLRPFLFCIYEFVVAGIHPFVRRSTLCLALSLAHSAS